jgi:hypothetical protein
MCDVEWFEVSKDGNCSPKIVHSSSRSYCLRVLVVYLFVDEAFRQYQ